MAYATKYRFEFLTTHGATCRIDIELDGYDGEVIQRALGRAPVLKMKKSGSICGSSLEIYAQCEVEGEFAELYTTNPRAFRVSLYHSTMRQVCIWRGYVSTEIYSEPDIAPPYDVRIIATDCLGELKNDVFNNDGLRSAHNHFTYLLSATGLDQQIYYATTFHFKSGVNEDPVYLPDLQISLGHMVGEKCYDVLQRLLESVHAVIFTYQEKWYIVNESELETLSGSNILRAVKVTNGVAGMVNTDIANVVVGSMSNTSFWPIGNLSRSIVPAKKAVTLSNPMHYRDLLRDTKLIKERGSTVWTDDAVTAGGWGSDIDKTSVRGFCLQPNYSTTDWTTLAQQLRLGEKGSLSTAPVTITVKAIGITAPSSGFDPENTGKLQIYARYLIAGVGQSMLLYGTKDGWHTDDTHIETYDLERKSFAPIGGWGSVGSKDNHGDTFEVRIPSVFQSLPSFEPISRELWIYVKGRGVYVNSVELKIDDARYSEYKAVVHIDNGARTEESTVEVLGCGEPVIMVGERRLLGVWMVDGEPVETRSFNDSVTTYGMLLETIARSYAKSVCAPRIRLEGVINTGVRALPLILFRYSGSKYLVETYDFDLYNDEIKISAISLPVGTLSVESETVTPIE